MNTERRPLMIIFYILLIAPFFQLELLENLIPYMGKFYTLWQLLAGGAFCIVWYRRGGKIRDFSVIHLLFAALLLIIAIVTLMTPDASPSSALRYICGSM